jgi:hypothetical protein
MDQIGAKEFDQTMPSGGYSLAALFLLVTATAIVLAIVGASTSNQNQTQGEWIVAHAVVGAFFGGAIGFWTALSYRRRRSNIAIGSFAGAITGGACAAAAAAGASFWLFVGGSVGLVLFGLADRLIHGNRSADG